MLILGTAFERFCCFPHKSLPLRLDCWITDLLTDTEDCNHLTLLADLGVSHSTYFDVGCSCFKDKLSDLASPDLSGDLKAILIPRLNDLRVVTAVRVWILVLKSILNLSASCIKLRYCKGFILHRRRTSLCNIDGVQS